MTVQPVLIVEDDPTWQSLFAEIISDAGYQAIVTTSYIAAINAVDAGDFALAVVDISLSLPDHADRGGVKVLQAIAERGQLLPAIVVTGYATVDLAVETLAELDARYLFRKEEFNRKKFIEIVQQIIGDDDSESALGLSDREHEVLLLMSQGLTNKQIAEILVVSVNTIKKHTQNIFTKLNVDSRTAAVAKMFKDSAG